MTVEMALIAKRTMLRAFVVAVSCVTVPSLPAHAFESYSCPTPGPIVAKIEADGYYRRDDPTHSIIDADRQMKYRAATAPINDLFDKLGKVSDDYLKDRNPDVKQCMQEIFMRWASSSGLLELGPTVQAGFVQQWSLATLAILRYKVGPFDEDVERITRAWLSRMAESVEQFHEKREIARRNNHFYWAVLGVGTTGLIFENAKFIAFAEDGYKFAINSIRENGTLEQELRRGNRSTTYHAFAAEPLAIYRLLRHLEGLPPVDGERRLDTLLDLVRRGISDPGEFGAITGTTPLPIGTQPWLEMIDAVYANDGSLPRGFDRRLGGDVGMLGKVLLLKGAERNRWAQ